MSSCRYRNQEGASYGSGSSPLFNGTCECPECVSAREEEEAEEEERQQNSSGLSGILTYLVKQRVKELTKK